MFILTKDTFEIWSSVKFVNSKFVYTCHARGKRILKHLGILLLYPYNNREDGIDDSNLFIKLI